MRSALLSLFSFLGMFLPGLVLSPLVVPTWAAAGESEAVVRFDSFVRSMDRDGDGSLSREETGDVRWFDRIDRDDDGRIGQREIARVRRLVGRFGDRLFPPEPDIEIDSDRFAEVTSGPETLKPESVGVGRMTPDVTFRKLDGTDSSLGGMMGERGLVVAMTSATCPVSKRYLPTLLRLSDELSEKGYGFLFVNPFRSESEAEIREQLGDAGSRVAYVRDEDGAVSRALDAATTTEVFLLDPARTLRYRGAIDDQYGVDYSVSEPRHHFLAEAVAAYERGDRPDVEATLAPGCEIDVAVPGKEQLVETRSASDVTYHRDVSRILQRNCIRCHHDGGIAPFGLEDHEEVTDRARVIRRVVTERTMPPWFAAPPESGGSSPWANDHSLSERDRSDLLAWLESSDRPLGDPADAPEALVFSDEWSIGEPDLVISASRAYAIPATGVMPYQYDRVRVELEEDRWVRGYEIQPSERDVVHHVLVHVFEPGSRVTRTGEGGVGYWAAYVPGNAAHVFPEGFARKLPAGATIQFQIHYTPSGEAKKERLRMGLLFAEERPEFEVRTLPVVDRVLRIPPGEPAHVEGTEKKIGFDLPVLGFMPHMHTRGAAFRYAVTYPDGERETLLDIPRYDFNWQLRYELRKPKLIPRGSTIEVTGVFDNSERNRANPDPTRTVRWGAQTSDEMLIGYIEYFVPVPPGEEVAVTE